MNKRVLVQIILCSFLLWTGTESQDNFEIFEISESSFSNDMIPFRNRYQIEEHKVETQDGYILTLHRLGTKENSSSENDCKNRKKPVFLQHALALESGSWFWGISNNVVLPFYLFDAGYDIWLGNSRGTYYSLNHTKLNYKTSKEFWNFSWNELGIYDLPAAIDYVLNVTNSDKLHYVGHSQGTTQFFVLTSELPEYNKKILSAHNIAPAILMKNINNPLAPFVAQQFAMPNNEIIDWVKRPMPVITNLFSRLFAGFCKLLRGARICINAITNFIGSEGLLRSPHINQEIAVKMYENFPQGTSLKCFIHYIQIIKSGHFRKFDYGTVGNLKIYKMEKPPDYDLSKITCPVFLYYSKYDSYNSYSGNIKLSKVLENNGALRLNYSVPFKYRFNHIDFIYGKIAKKLIFEKILNGIEQLEIEDSNNCDKLFNKV